MHDLVCEEPYMIGFMGAISFISFSVGSLVFTNIADSKGRKMVVLVASLITPLGILALVLFADNLYKIFVIQFIVGLTYNPRGSVAYLYGTEFLGKKQKLNFGQMNFILSGIIHGLSALWFYTIKDQNLYFMIIAILLLIAMLWILIFVPESPLFLYEKHEFQKFTAALEYIAKFNGVKDYQFKIELAVEKLKQKILREQ